MNGHLGDIDKGRNDEVSKFYVTHRRFETTDTYIHKNREKRNVSAPSVGEVPNNTSTEVQRKIHNLRNKFIVLRNVHCAVEL